MDFGNIRSMYQISNLSSLAGGIEGYFVQKKYVDANKIKLEKMYASKEKPSSLKPTNVPQKKTFIDEVQKIAAKLPSPTAYDPKQFKSKSKTQSLVQPGNRKTIFDQIQHLTKKSNFPDPAKYNKVETQVDKSKLRSNLSKAQNSNFLESSMRGSLDAPGVGNYNSNKSQFGSNQGYKWIIEKNRSKSSNKTNFPPVGTYNPKPIDYSLFQSLISIQKGKSRPYFAKTERFKSAKKKDIPYYNVLSQWGLQKKGSSKDILTKVSKTSGHHSVYY